MNRYDKLRKKFDDEYYQYMGYVRPMDIAMFNAILARPIESMHWNITKDKQHLFYEDGSYGNFSFVFKDDHKIMYYKPFDFWIAGYKHTYRGLEMNKALTQEQWDTMWYEAQDMWNNWENLKYE